MRPARRQRVAAGRASPSRRVLSRSTTATCRRCSSPASCWRRTCRSASSRATADRRWRSSTAIVAELMLGRLTYGKWPHLASAYITGISVGILVRSPFLWPYALVQPDLDRVEVRAARRTAGTSGTRRTSASAPCCSWRPATVALLSIQWGNNVWPMVGHLGARLGDRLARRPLAHQRHLRRVVPAVLVRAQRGHRQPVARRASRRSPGRCISCSSSS